MATPKQKSNPRKQPSQKPQNAQLFKGSFKENYNAFGRALKNLKIQPPKATQAKKNQMSNF